MSDLVAVFQSTHCIVWLYSNCTETIS